MISIPVRQVMRSPVQTISRHATAAEAAKELNDREIGSLVVINEHGELNGIITKSDINKIVAEVLIPGDVSAEVIMSSPLITVREMDSLQTAAELMRTNSIKKLPVLNESDKLVGMIAAVDLAYYLPAYAKRIHSRIPTSQSR